jgi:hypothetical protein
MHRIRRAMWIIALAAFIIGAFAAAFAEDWGMFALALFGAVVAVWLMPAD